MKKILLAISIFNFLLLASYVFAQFNNMVIKIANPPIPGDLPHPGDEPEFVPINDYFWFLLVAGIVYAFYKFRSMHLQKTQ